MHNGDGRKGTPPKVDLHSQLRKLVDDLREEVRALRKGVQALRDELTALNERKQDVDMLKATLSPDEVAEKHLGISRRTLDDLEAEGKITAVQVGGQVRYEPQEVADFIRRNRREAGRK
jgi:excisionase family DNA binding protein